MSCGSEVVKTNNRSSILFSECWLLCSFLLQVSTGPHNDAWGWLGGELRAWCSFSQDDVKIEEQVSYGKIRAAGVERSHLCTEVVE